MNVKNVAARLAEFNRVLKYTFGIDISEKCAPSALPIAEEANEAFKICKFFLNQGDPHFFGIANQVAESFDTLNTDPIISLFSSVDFDVRWKKILLDDAVVYVYSMLRDIIVGKSKVDASTALQCANVMNQPGELIGMEYLLNKETIVLDKNLRLKLKDKRDRSDQMKQYVTSHNMSYKNQLQNIDQIFLELFPWHERYVLKGKEDNPDYLFLGNSEYAGMLRAVSKKLKVLEKMYSQGDDGFYNIHCQKYTSMCREMMDVLEKSTQLTQADILYAQYKMEKELNICLGDCLYQNITALEGKLQKKLIGQRDIEALAQCAKLPNIFSRSLFIDSAFIALENILKSPELAQNDCFMQILSGLRGGMVTYGHQDAYSYPIDVWMALYRRMVDYLADFLFPMYESIFMLLFYRSERIRVRTELDYETSKHRNNTQAEQLLLERTFYSMFRRLGKYLNEQDIDERYRNEEYLNRQETTKDNQTKQYLTEDEIKEDRKPCVKQEVLDPLGGKSKQKAFEGLIRTCPKFDDTEDRGQALKYKWCISNMKHQTETKMPLRLDDLNELIPDRETMWNHAILQIAKVSERIY